MKQFIFIIILLFFLPDVLWAQSDLDGDSPGSINLNNPVYDDFFIGSCTQNSEKSANIKSITKYYQGDSPWNTDKYVVCDGETIGSFGCHLTCIAMMLTNLGATVTPRQLNEFVKTNTRYYNIQCGLYASTIVDQYGLDQYGLPNSVVKEIARSDKVDYEKMKSVLNRGGFIIAHVTHGDPCRHFILIYDWTNYVSGDVFLTTDPLRSSNFTKLDDYEVCPISGYRYYIPTANAIVSKIAVNGDVPAYKVVNVPSGLPQLLNVEISGLKNATITENTTDCTKQLWVVKDQNGQVLEHQPNTDTYTFNQFGQYTNGTYYVSYAINNEFGFDGESVEIIVGDGSSGGGPIVVNPPDHCVNPPTCGNGICDPGEENACQNCRFGDCGTQFVDEGFRINGYFDNVVSVCRNSSIELTPKRGSFYLGKEVESYACLENLLISPCYYYWYNVYADVIECNNDLTETPTVFHYASRWKGIDIDPIDLTIKEYDGIDCRILTEGKYYKIVLKTYFGDNNDLHSEGWISSYKYIYILPSSDMYYDSSSYDEHIAHPEIAIVGQTISGNVVVKAQNSIKIYPSTHISANFNAIIDPSLPFVCNTTKSAKIDTLNISGIHDISYTPYISGSSIISNNTNNKSPDIKDLGISTEESNISIYPNPTMDHLQFY